MKQSTRIEDMSKLGRIFVFQENDGDLIVGISEQDEDGLIAIPSRVQFCTSFSGGGHSPNTYAALLELKKAIDLDNQLHPEKNASIND